MGQWWLPLLRTPETPDTEELNVVMKTPQEHREEGEQHYRAPILLGAQLYTTIAATLISNGRIH